MLLETTLFATTVLATTVPATPFATTGADEEAVTPEVCSLDDAALIFSVWFVI
jgi:hypothetical protein